MAPADYTKVALDVNGDIVGMIAQEVQKKIPEIVRQGVNKEYLSVDYAKVVPFLIEAVKKQQDQIKKLKKEINNLRQ